LQAQGERVAALCLIDVPGVRPAGAGWKEGLQRGLRGLRRRLKLWRTYTRERLQPHLPLPPVPTKTSRRYYDEQGRLQPGRRLRYAQNLAGLRYRPLPYDGSAGLIRSAEHSANGALRGWPQIVRGGIAVTVVPGTTHADLLSNREHLRVMAGWLNACLAQADPPARAAEPE
jgi:hypothetical protein